MSGYPECKNAKPIVENIDVPCPICGAKVQVRKKKRKKKYYICEHNPETCNYISWNKPKNRRKVGTRKRKKRLQNLKEKQGRKNSNQ